MITNHFYLGNTGIDRRLPWGEFVKAYADDYYLTEAYGKTKGITVLFGIEDGFGFGKEMLIYGVTPEALADLPQLAELNPREKAELFRSLGGFVVCAHPFRHRSYIPEPVLAPDPTLFDGIEVFNACNAPEENTQAGDLCRENHLIPTAGSDAHRAEGLGLAGVDFEEEIHTSLDFIQALKEEKYSLFS